MEKVLNFICLNWGSKYNTDFVNKLYNMINRKFNNFKLHCITEPEKTEWLKEEINVIPLPDDNLEKWWWKIWLFNEEWMQLDNCVFLDLDLVIQKPFIPTFGNKPKVLFTDWIDTDELWNGINQHSHRYYDYCEINSSVIMWNKNTKRQHIFDAFQENKEKILFLFRGMDNYINNRHKNEYDIIPQIAHSYWTTGKTWKDVPVILFDYNENKQDTVNEEWVKCLWK